jgi:hypothetical protein
LRAGKIGDQITLILYGSPESLPRITSSSITFFATLLNVSASRKLLRRYVLTHSWTMLPLHKLTIQTFVQVPLKDLVCATNPENITSISSISKHTTRSFEQKGPDKIRAAFDTNAAVPAFNTSVARISRKSGARKAIPSIVEMGSKASLPTRDNGNSIQVG